MFQPIQPVLAAGESIVGIIVLTISVVSWIVSLFQDKKAVPNARNRRPKNNVQSELEQFIEEVEKKNVPERNRPAAQKPTRPPGGEKRKPKPGQKPAILQTQSKPKPQPQPQTPNRNTQTSRPVTRLTETPFTSSVLGEGVRSHVASHLESRNVDSNVEKDIDSTVRRDIDGNVQRDLGSGLGKDTTVTAQRSVPVHPLMHALRNPQGVRQAIIMAEILNRPKLSR